jgi:hypothetical protein
MTVTGWIGIGSLGIVGSGVCLSMMYSAKEAVRRSMARKAATSTEVPVRAR